MLVLKGGSLLPILVDFTYDKIFEKCTLNGRFWETKKGMVDKLCFH